MPDMERWQLTDDLIPPLTESDNKWESQEEELHKLGMLGSGHTCLPDY